MIRMAGRLHAATFSCRSTFYLPARLGKYGAIVGDDIQVREGAVVEFECINPACQRNFTAGYDSDLAEIKMTDADGRPYVVVFNKTCGRHSTFLVDWKAKALVSSFGPHANEDTPDFGKGLNFFGD
jgi:hypothetical protein